MGPAGAPLEEHAIRCGRTDGYGYPHTHAAHRVRLGARRQGADGQEPDPGPWNDDHDIHQHDVHRQEVDGSQVDEAGGRREEGGRHEEAENRAGPQGHSPEVHRQEVHGSQVHEACNRREEGRGDPEAKGRTGQEVDAEDHGPQVHRQEVDGTQVHEAGGRREEGGRHEEAEDRAGPQGHSPEVNRSQVHGSQVHGSQVHQARGRRQESGSDEEAENGGGTPCPRSEHPLRDGESGSGADAVGDSPGEPFEIPDTPVAVEESGTTAEEQRERSLERRLAMDEPDASPTDPPAAEGARPHPILDDDVATEDAVAEDSDGPADEADLDRTREEVGELSSDPAESAEESAMHIERE